MDKDCKSKFHLSENDKRMLKRILIQCFPCPSCECPQLPKPKLRLEETGEQQHD